MRGCPDDLTPVGALALGAFVQMGSMGVSYLLMPEFNVRAEGAVEPEQEWLRQQRLKQAATFFPTLNYMAQFL